MNNELVVALAQEQASQTIPDDVCLLQECVDCPKYWTQDNTVFEGHLAQFVSLWNQIENFKVLCLWNGAFGFFYELFFECSCSLAKTQLAFYKKMKFNLYFLICAICTAVTSIKKNQFLSCGCYCSCRFLLHFFLSSLKSYSTNQIQFNTKVYGSGSDIFLV